jgi:5'-methylthioadenosine phosphorylase
VIASAIDRLPFDRTCECASALKYAIITRPESVPDQVRRDLAPIVGRYL